MSDFVEVTTVEYEGVDDPVYREVYLALDSIETIEFNVSMGGDAEVRLTSGRTITLAGEDWHPAGAARCEAQLNALGDALRARLVGTTYQPQGAFRKADDDDLVCLNCGSPLGKPHEDDCALYAGEEA